METLLTVPEAAERLRVTPKAAWHMVDRHELPVIRIGRRVRVRLSDLERLIADAARRAEGKGAA